MYIYIYVYGSSRLFLHFEMSHVVPVVCCMSFARYVVCVVCRAEAVLCAGSSL